MKLVFFQMFFMFAFVINAISIQPRDEPSFGESFTNPSVPDKCNRGNYQIKNQSELDEITDCKIIHGDITISDYTQSILDLGDIETVTGSLIIHKSPEIVRIESEKLTNIGNELGLSDLTSLSVIVFPSLSSVRVIDWRVLPILSSVQFFNEISDLKSVTIADTSLTGFSGFLAEKLETLDINNNRFLDSISSNVEVIENSLHISANSLGTIVSLPKLRVANNMSIQDISEIDLSNLESVKNSISIINNQLSSLKLSSLKSIGGTLNIFKNKKLTDLDFPSMTEVGGGLIIANNSNIEKINFFPKLNIIGGALEVVGNVKEISIKQLKLIKGSTKLRTDYPSFDCSLWLRSDIISVIRGGKIECSNANNEKFISNAPKFNNSSGSGNYIDGKFEQNYPSLTNNTLYSASSTTNAPILELITELIFICLFEII